MFGRIAIASILTAAGCGRETPNATPEPPVTNLAGKPRALFLLFGDRTDPRALPIATLVAGKVLPIELDERGWRGFDQLYFPAGGSLAVYQNGQQVADAQIRRGMWSEEAGPLYKLPACRALRPLAAVTLASAPSDAVMLELLATSDPLPALVLRTRSAAADVDSARALAARTGQREGLTTAARAELDLVASALPTGATGHPTLAASYLEQGNGVTGSPRHVFVLGDWSETAHGYTSSFVHVPDDASREFRRMIDHVDLTGDGVDEIVIEGWRIGGESYLIFLQYQQSQWREIARGATSWCADPKVK